METKKSTKAKEDKKAKKEREKIAKGVAEAINSNEKIKLAREEKRVKKERAKDQKELEELEFFFGKKGAIIPADPEGFEGHYPGSQDNTVLIPYRSRVIHR